MKKDKKYQVKVAVSTITERGLPRYIDKDRWYDVVVGNPYNGPCFWITDGIEEKWVCTSLKDSGHLKGGNWKARIAK